jgi:SulP family sulfate permease
MALLLLVPTGWMSPLPLSALAATIMIAVLGMLDLETPLEAWRYDRSDALAWGITLGGVLLLGVEEGVIVGLLLSLGTLIAKASRPHIAVLGRIPGTEHFRNVARHAVETRPELLLLRVDAGIFFGNAEHISDSVLEQLQDSHREVVLVMSAVNQIDTTGLYALSELNRVLSGRDLRLNLAEVKGPVMDRLHRSNLLLQQLSGKVFLSTAAAFNALSEATETPASER